MNTLTGILADTFIAWSIRNKSIPIFIKLIIPILLTFLYGRLLIENVVSRGQERIIAKTYLSQRRKRRKNRVEKAEGWRKTDIVHFKRSQAVWIYWLGDLYK